MVQCALLYSNICKQCSLCADNKGTLVIHYKGLQIPVVNMTVKDSLSANPIQGFSQQSLKAGWHKVEKPSRGSGGIFPQKCFFS